MICPMKFVNAYYSEYECEPDCAWLVTQDKGKRGEMRFCALPSLVAMGRPTLSIPMAKKTAEEGEGNEQ